MTKYFVFDTETAGRTTDTSLLTIYGILVDQNFTEYPDGRIDFKIKPDNGVYSVDVEALKINNIDLVSHDKEAKPLSQVKNEFENWVCRHGISSIENEKIIPVGQCVSFDIKFVKKYLMPYMWYRYFSKRCIDTGSIALFLQQTNYIPKELNCSLSSLVKYFNIDTMNKQMHNAKTDAENTMKVWQELTKLLV